MKVKTKVRSSRTLLCLHSVFWPSYSCREAQVFVGSIHVSDDNSHHISQGLLTSWIESGFLLHNLDNDFRNNLRSHTCKTNTVKLGENGIRIRIFC